MEWKASISREELKEAMKKGLKALAEEYNYPETNKLVSWLIFKCDAIINQTILLHDHDFSKKYAKSWKNKKEAAFLWEHESEIEDEVIREFDNGVLYKKLIDFKQLR